MAGTGLAPLTQTWMSVSCTYHRVYRTGMPGPRQPAPASDGVMVDLVVLDAGQVINLEQFVPPERQVKDIGRVGRRTCPHCTAAGKVLLASLPPEELEQALPDELVRFTAHTITDRDRLVQELARVRRRGYAEAREELRAAEEVPF